MKKQKVANDAKKHLESMFNASRSEMSPYRKRKSSDKASSSHDMLPAKQRITSNF